jgi:hypothetical protein
MIFNLDFYLKSTILLKRILEIKNTTSFYNLAQFQPQNHFPTTFSKNCQIASFGQGAVKLKSSFVVG